MDLVAGKDLGRVLRSGLKFHSVCEILCNLAQKSVGVQALRDRPAVVGKYYW